MNKILEKETYEAPVLMEISPVSFVAVQGESGGTGTGSPDTPIGGETGDLD